MTAIALAVLLRGFTLCYRVKLDYTVAVGRLSEALTEALKNLSRRAVVVYVHVTPSEATVEARFRGSVEEAVEAVAETLGRLPRPFTILPCTGKASACYTVYHSPDEIKTVCSLPIPGHKAIYTTEDAANLKECIVVGRDRLAPPGELKALKLRRGDLLVLVNPDNRLLARSLAACVKKGCTLLVASRDPLPLRMPHCSIPVDQEGKSIRPLQPRR